LFSADKKVHFPLITRKRKTAFRLYIALKSLYISRDKNPGDFLLKYYEWGIHIKNVSTFKAGVPFLGVSN